MSNSAALGAWRRRARRARDGRRRPSPKAVATAAAIALGCALLGGRALGDHHPTVEQRRAITGPPPCPAAATELHADVDGDGCDEDVTFGGGVLTAGPLRMRVGAPGDQIALGRWTCGAVSLALLRPSTGEVFRFDSWATQGSTVAAVVIGRVEGADGVRAATRAGGRCDDVVVTRPSGPPVLLPERPVAG